MPEGLGSDRIKVTDLQKGPYAVRFIDNEGPEEDLGFLVCPPGGFESREAARKWLDEAWSNTWDGMSFEILALRTPDSFIRYMSWAGS